MIAIIDYGLGNLFSIYNMLKHIGVQAIITSNASEISNASKLILPGVGAFDEGMKLLSESGLDSLIKREVTNNGKPILGICLGMQLLGTRSEEGEMRGLELIDFKSIRFREDRIGGLNVPHMGWERVEFVQKNCGLLDGLYDSQRYYFIHSYHAVCKNKNDEMIRCYYGYDFTAGVHKGNIYGVQFHPEKSHKYGMKLLENYARNC